MWGSNNKTKINQTRKQKQHQRRGVQSSQTAGSGSGCGGGGGKNVDSIARLQRIRNRSEERYDREGHQPEDIESSASTFQLQQRQGPLPNRHDQLTSLSQSTDQNETPRKKNIQTHSGAVWKKQNPMKSDQLHSPHHNIHTSRSPVIRRSPSRRVNPIIRRFIQRRTK